MLSTIRPTSLKAYAKVKQMLQRPYIEMCGRDIEHGEDESWIDSWLSEEAQMARKQALAKY